MANANIETVSKPLDKVKVALAIVALIGGIVGFYLLADYPLVVRVICVLVGLGVAIGIGYTSEPGKRFYAFGRDAVEETKKVVWPTRKETLQTTGVVVGFVIIMALFLWLTDKTLELVLYDWILGWRR